MSHEYEESRSPQRTSKKRNMKKSSFQGQSPTAKISPVKTNPENTHSHEIAHISSSRDDKSNL